MIKLLLILISFVKELFVNKNELNITHHSFSFSKAIRMLVIAISLVLNYVLINALINVTHKYRVSELSLAGHMSCAATLAKKEIALTYLESTCIKGLARHDKK